jgi:transposase
MNEITTVGVDLAKDVIVVCAGDASGKTVYFRQFGFGAFAMWAANLPPCVFGMEACSSAHHWARRLASFGHTPRLMAAEFVKPFRKSQGAKNDRNDARAILSAVREPDMRFVAPKSADQQAILAWHRMRAGWMAERTALVNRLRGLLAEFGLWFNRSPNKLLRALPELAASTAVPERFKPILSQVREQIDVLDQRIEECEREINVHAKASPDAQRISALIGIGALTSSAAVATAGDTGNFRNGRQFAAWLGLVPKQHSSGGKDRLGAITKRGNAYLRGLLTQGARSTVQVALRRPPEQRSRLEQWIVALHDRVGYRKALVAVANKHARIIWAILDKREDYDPNAWQRLAASTANA